MPPDLHRGCITANVFGADLNIARTVSRCGIIGIVAFDRVPEPHCERLRSAWLTRGPDDAAGLSPLLGCADLAGERPAGNRSLIGVSSNSAPVQSTRGSGMFQTHPRGP
jgi:hypothetical protein